MGADKLRLSRKEAARFLVTLGVKITPKTLTNMAANSNAGGGPPFTRVGWTQVFYEREDLETWARMRMRRVSDPRRPPMAPA